MFSRITRPILAGLLALSLCSPGFLQAQQARRPRQLAPGVLTVMAPAAEKGETSSGPAPLVEITAGLAKLTWKPNFDSPSNTLVEKSKELVFRREIWCFEFAFKPLRMIEVDLPQPTGRMQRKLIWYVVYRIRDLGKDEKPVGAPSTPTLPFDKPGQRRFFPHFVLESHEYRKSYLSRLIPAAQEAIQAREMPDGTPLHNIVEIASVPIPQSDERTERGVWGVVTWEDLDPRMDYFSIYVRGLTNAFEFTDPAGALKPGDPPGTGREFRFKTLQLNFWRPGDAAYQHEDEIVFGVPIDSDPEKQLEILSQYGLEQRVDYRWVYR